MRRAFLILATLGAASLQAPAAAAAPQDFVVLYAKNVSPEAGRAAVEAAGGRVISEIPEIGVATVRSAGRGFASVARRASALDGVAADRMIGSAPKARTPIEKPSGPVARSGKPVGDLQWNLKQIAATAAHSVERGDQRVLVGVMDTGIDASHPDIAPNFNRELSRNFTTDLPYDANGTEIDGPCEREPDQSCSDPADVDENEHGTHVASIIASPADRKGVTGVAPGVSLVNLRVGQDSGYFFLKPTLDALVYAAQNGIDVVNMSYYIDPWLWNCTDNPADSAKEKAEQRTIIKAVNRALWYARLRNVTLVGSAGNGSVDYTKTNDDASSPDFAAAEGQFPRPRTVPPKCASLPAEGFNVIAVSDTGITRRKGVYSSYGLGYVDIAAPGGDKYDNPAMKADNALGVWAAYPKAVAVAAGNIDADGKPTVPYVVREGGAYYQSLQGTSMASPHVTGVIALIISKFGFTDPSGLTMPPRRVESKLFGAAVQTPCPEPAEFTYKWFDDEGNAGSSTQKCEGVADANGFYGRGIVNAYHAVS